MAKVRSQTLKDFEAIAAADGRLCLFCGQRPASQIHHIIPRAFFGKRNVRLQEDFRNLALLCSLCHNSDKVSNFKARAILIKRKAERNPDYDYSVWPWREYLEPQFD